MKTMIAFATVLLMASPAFGEDQPEHGGPMMMDHMERLKEADTNKNGTIEREEFDAMRAAKFAKLDPTGKGITQAEFPEAMERMRAEQRAERQKKAFQHMDANKDGVLTKNEFLSRNDEAFKRMDRNKDGKLSKEDRGRGN